MHHNYMEGSGSAAILGINIVVTCTLMLSLLSAVTWLVYRYMGFFFICFSDKNIIEGETGMV